MTVLKLLLPSLEPPPIVCTVHSPKSYFVDSRNREAKLESDVRNVELQPHDSEVVRGCLHVCTTASDWSCAVMQSGLQCRGCASAARAMHSRELTFNAGSGRSGGGGRSTGRGRGLRARGGRGIGGRGGSGGRARARPSTGALFDGAPSEEEEDSDPTFCGDEPPPRAKVCRNLS